MNSATEIINNALARLGESGIASIAGTSDKAVLMARHYESTRVACLTRRSWRFAITKTRLGKLSTAPANEWQNAFQLPPDMIKGPLAVFDSTAVGADPVLNWETYRNEVWADFDTCLIDYMVDVTTVTRFPSYFSELMILALCAASAPQIADSAELAQEYMHRAWGTPQENYSGGWYRVAARLDAGTTTPNRIYTGHLIAARRGGR